MSLLEVLKKYWGYDSFRPLQEQIIAGTMAGHDVVGLMPTGGGKSLTFQVPGMAEDGLTLVVTPLISLMKDQVDNLRSRRIKAVYFHAAMTSAEIRTAWELLVNGKCKFLYFSPERLKSERFCQELKHLNVRRIVIDEAHCISQWGFDFRPSYLEISKLRKMLPGVPMLALTATATENVVDDIIRELHLENPEVHRMSFRRNNISYIAREAPSPLDETLHILKSTSGPSIVYVRSRKKTTEIASALTSAGMSALPYHAGMNPEDKEKNQNAWMKDEVRVIVATNAFGMGIDKPDVRVVIHYDIPSSLEEYYQEAGRAGRDGLPSFAVLLFTGRSKGNLKARVTKSFPDRPIIRRIYTEICTYLNISPGEGYGSWKEFDIFRFCETFKRQEQQVSAVLRILSTSGWMDLVEDSSPHGRVQILMTREELYHVRELGELPTRMLDWMLRKCPGIFSDHVGVNETLASIHLNADTRAVIEALVTLAKAKIISYIPRRRMPMIFLPTACEEERYIQIPRTALEVRKEAMERRIAAVIDYTFNNKGCRVERMLAYFGDKDTGPCGTCDVCRKKRPQVQETDEEIVEGLTKALRESPGGLPIEKLCGSGSYSERRRLILRQLLDRGWLTYKDQLYHLKT